jgi:PAS domain S-box-containing protein
MWKAIRNAQVWSGEITNRRKDGSLFTEEMTITPVRNASGKITHFVAIKQDITERKRSELMLAGEKRVLEKIARGDPLLDILEALTRGAEEIVPGLMGSFLLLDEDGVRLRHAVAPNLPEAYNRAIDGLRIGPAAGSCGTAAFRKQLVIVEDTLTDPLWADFRELAQKYGLRACWSTPVLSSAGEVLGTFALYHREPRRPAPYEWQAIERVGYLAGIAINRSRAEEARRESEAQYRALVDNATYGIFRSTLDGRFLQVNPALVHLLGYTSAEELFALDLARDVYRNPADRAALLEQHRRVDRITGAEVEWKRKDGKIIAVRLNGNLVCDAQGEVREIRVIAEDITDRRAADRQLRMAQKYEAIGQLAGGIAHDFNNVIGAIMGWAEIAIEECPPEAPIRNRLEKIRDQAVRAAALTKQLLAFARRQMLEPRVVNLNEIVTDVTSLLDKVIGKDIELKTVLDANLQTTRADPTQVEQVLMNLCLNARDAMPRGGSIIIETQHFEVDRDYASRYPYARLGHYVVLIVSDTGVGMDAKVLEHVFEPFFTTKQIGKGTGLGLATVYGIVKQHGGFINVYSEPEHGTTFKVYFPVAVGESQARKEPETEESARGGSETILVAEDHVGISTMARELLERLGYHVLLAADGEEAVRIFEQEKDRIALALLDVVMPKLSGPEAYTRMCAIRPDLPVIFSTGYSAESAPLLGALAEKGVPILQKPYSPRILGRKIRDLLDRQKHS